MKILWYLLFFLFLTVVACSGENIKATDSDPKEPSRAELRMAMRYHGILFAKRDDKGDWYFERNGERCRLFSYVERRQR